MSYPGLSKSEVSEMHIIVDSIKSNPTSPKSTEYRKQLFVPKQKLAKIRYFFATTTIQLNPQELDVIKSIIVKPSSSEWSIISRIIQTQFQLSEEEILEWFDSVKPADRITVSIPFIADSRVKNVEYKLSLAKNLLKHPNYGRPLLMKMDELIVDGFEWWDKIFDLIIEYINEETELSKFLVRVWTELKHMDDYAKKKNIHSRLLYEKTGREHYLPKEVQDIFLF